MCSSTHQIIVLVPAMFWILVAPKLLLVVPAKLLRVVPAKFYFHLADIRLCLVGRKLLSFAG